MAADDIFLGIDIGGTTIKAGLVRRDGTLVKKQSFSTPHDSGNQAFLETLEASIDFFADQPYQGIGIGSVGPLDIETGTIFHTANIPGLKNCPVLETARRIAKKDIPIYINNDASVTALSQYYFGLGKNVANLLTITLGTGIGGGMVQNGQLYNGYKGNAFEIGHMALVDRWWQPQIPVRQCGCGSWGCFETYASATAIKENYKLLSEQKEDTTAKEIAARARKGDEHAKKAFEIAGHSIGSVCVSITHLLNFPLVIITGGLAAAHDLIAPAMQAVLDERLFDVFKGYMQVKFTEGDENYGIMGAAALHF